MHQPRCIFFQSKVRIYILTYQHLVMLELENNNIKVYSRSTNDRYGLEYNEKMHKSYRSHRDTNIIEGDFIAKVMKECIVRNWILLELST